MHSKKKYTRPHLRVVQPTDARWRDHLPKVRELTQKALNEMEASRSADIVAKLESLLELIDAEITAEEEKSR